MIPVSGRLSHLRYVSNELATSVIEYEIGKDALVDSSGKTKPNPLVNCTIDQVWARSRNHNSQD